MSLQQQGLGFGPAAADRAQLSTEGGWAALRQAAQENRSCTRRVRYEVRDGVAVAAFSAAASTGLTLLITFALSRVG